MCQQAPAWSALQAGATDSWFRVRLNVVPTGHLGLLLNLDSTFVNKSVSAADAAGTLPFWPWLPLTFCDAPCLPCQSLLPDMLPPPPGPLHRLYLGTSLPSSSSLIYSFQSNLMDVFFRKVAPDKVKFTPSHLCFSRHLSIRVIITARILYLLVLNSIYCPLWNVSCLRGDNTPVLLIDLYHVPATVSQLVTTL